MLFKIFILFCLFLVVSSPSLTHFLSYFHFTASCSSPSVSHFLGVYFGFNLALLALSAKSFLKIY